MSTLWVEITATRGSTPRDAGTVMKVTAKQTYGTIGGGALEYKAIATARAMLAKGETARSETLPLGPNLGQCCGGVVTLQYTDKPQVGEIVPMNQFIISPHGPDPMHLWLWGAGHVGRAVVKGCHRQAFDITWIDSAPDRFPTSVASNIKTVPTADMPRLAAHAPTYTHHLIFTYSHDIDLALCAALLRHGAASIGLIGSETKWNRFQRRLTAMGLDPAPITCPIGDKSLGKAPDQIANGTITALLSLTHLKATA